MKKEIETCVKIAACLLAWLVSGVVFGYLVGYLIGLITGSEVVRDTMTYLGGTVFCIVIGIHLLDKKEEIDEENWKRKHAGRRYFN